MKALACFAAVLLPCLQPAFSQEAKLPNGVYAVERESLSKNELLPIKAGETMVVNNFRYQKKGAKAAPLYLVVGTSPSVRLDLATAPKAEKSGDEISRILLKLRPEAAKSLEKVTQERLGRSLAIVVDGDVVTAHKIRSVIRGGDVQISNCAPDAAPYLLKHLEAVYMPRR